MPLGLVMSPRLRGAQRAHRTHRAKIHLRARRHARRRCFGVPHQLTIYIFTNIPCIVYIYSYILTISIVPIFGAQAQTSVSNNNRAYLCGATAATTTVGSSISFNANIYRVYDIVVMVYHHWCDLIYMNAARTRQQRHGLWPEMA